MERISYDCPSSSEESIRSPQPVVICPPKPQNMQQDAEQIVDNTNEINTVVAALNFGNTYSGYAFSTKSDFEKDPLHILINEKRISTCALFNNKNQLISFGYKAEREWANYGVEYRNSCLLSRHFQETLNIDETIGKDEDVLENKCFIFVGFLKALIGDCEERMKKKGVEKLDRVKRWVITIPADMTDIAEQFLKNCIRMAGIPLNQFILVTEVKASFAYCQKLLESERNSKLEDSTEYMIVDLGDYYADIIVVKKVCGELREKYRQTRTKRRPSVYQQFMKILPEHLGNHGMKILKDDPLAFLEIERRLEEVQLPANGEKEMCVELHVSTLDALRNIVNNGEINSKIRFTNKNMILPQSTFGQIFKDSIMHVTSQMEKVFQVYREANKISHIVMTGNFPQCCLVKENVEKKIDFPKKRIICSAIEENIVVKGAVLYGWQQQYKHTFELRYDKLANQKGFVLIINFLFEDTKHERKGSREDVLQLNNFFFNKNDFNVWNCADMTSEELESKLISARSHVMEKCSDHYHSFFCVIMSHGNQNGIMTTSGTISVEQIVSPFKNDQAKSFIGKPKIFLVQACRGHGKQDLNKYEIPRELNEGFQERLKTPTDADIIKIYATTPGYVSLRKTQSPKWIGAWFIHAFITAAEKYPKNHLLEILTAVNYELANNPEYVFEDGKKGQMSMAEVTLTKLFYFKD